ncbi:LysR family transcriptional regulator [Epibacterium ulvae]|uniref:Transcriptional regulator, LysR family n=1 Tax=Epibacterium ulvae TaxID=1156985 RepID=A0A1G5QYD3_9RHOB|nr:LysR family transcriptional regulator [Epibacterium ulvae]SCZ66261.1 transcriptional regulator, LysR family [Epibacterium ulvae]
MENWDEVRTAYQVARMGTVSGAAEVMGVHHATVIRHIDAIEARLGVKLFQRHARGYTPTEAGQDLLRVAQTTDDQFNQLVGRLKGQGEDMSGELVVTSLQGMASMLVPVLTDYQKLHPDLTIRYLTGDRLFRLEYGEAHVAIRAGNAPDQPDNVVQAFRTQKYALYATEDYVARHGRLKDVQDLGNHRLIAGDEKNSRVPYFKWLRENAPEENLMFRVSHTNAMHEAVLAGTGIGFMPCWQAERVEGLVQMMAPLPEWQGRLWLVTHVDLHRTAKVQSFLTFLKEEAKSWSD